MTKLLIDLWQKYGLTYNKTTVWVMTKLHIDLWQIYSFTYDK